MPILTKRWDEPADTADGHRILVTRYLPRGLPKEQWAWEAWMPNLGPSRELHAAAYGKGQFPVSWEVYRKQYLAEMQSQKPAIAQLAERVRQGQTITLLCSTACVRESRCHRSLLRDLIEASAADADTAPL